MAFAKNFPLENHKHKLNLSLTNRWFFFPSKFFIGSEPRKHSHLHAKVQSSSSIIMKNYCNVNPRDPVSDCECDLLVTLSVISNLSLKFNNT